MSHGRTDRLHRACQHHRHGELGAADGIGFRLPGATRHYPPDIRIEPRHIDLALEIDIAAETMDGVVTHTVVGRDDGARTLELHAVAFESVSVRELDERPVRARYDGEKIEIRWQEPFEAGEERRVEITYRVESPMTGLMFSHPTDEYPDKPWFAVTDNETERARHWFPSIDLPSVRPTLDFHLRAESRFTALANGERVGREEHDDGTATTHWRLEQRCPSYLTCVAVGDFVRFDDAPFGDIPVSYFTVKPHTPEDLERGFGRTRAMLEWMTEKLGMDFPYPKYFQFAVPGIGGAMENISLVSWDMFAVLEEPIVGELGWLVDQVNAHEMAHSYFGDLVVCRDYAHAWLKESWATYMELCWLEHSKGRDEADYDFYRCAQSYFSEADSSYKRAIVTRHFNSSWDMYDMHLYPGGAARLHTLRNHLGDETFWRGVRTYLERYAQDVVETDDFRRSLEEVSGRSLGQFFDQWLLTPGYPDLKVEFSYDEDEGLGTFEIEQKQATSSGGTGSGSDDNAGDGDDSPVFELDLELGWMVDGELHVRSIRVEEPRDTCIVSIDREPDQVRVDPHGKTLAKVEFDPGRDKLRRQLGADDVIGRITAGKVLVGSGEAKNIEAVRDAWRDEEFWGVRSEWGKALAKSKTQTAIDALAEVLEDETDPLVLHPVIDASIGVRDGGLAEVMRARLDADSLPPRAAGAAWEMLGGQHESAPFDALVEAARGSSPRMFVQRGAVRGIARSRHEHAGEVLRELLEYGAASNELRPHVARALGGLARVLERGAREAVLNALVDALRDPEHAVRAGAARGLRAAVAREVIEALRSYAAPLSHQQRVGVRRLIAGIRADAEKKAREARVDELEEGLRKLEARLRKLEARHADED